MFLRFNLQRQIVNKNIIDLISKEVRKQRALVTKASNTYLKGIAASLQQIKSDGIPSHLVRKKLGNNLGYGIFLKLDSKPISKGEVIAPYSGVVSLVPSKDPNDTGYMFELLSNIHLNKEEQFLIHPVRPYRPKRLYSLQLDAQKKGNFTRFINHSEKPNLVAYLLSTPLKNLYRLEPMPIEVVYIAQKAIQPGEQLLISYEHDGASSYWGPSKIKPFPMTPQTFTLS